jgi:glycerol-3-phosphate acyltransferase PlsY
MLVIFFIIAFSTKYISLASVMGMLLYPIVLYNIDFDGLAYASYEWL